ncbi:TPA: hypothetical protein L3889_000493 [Pseudomonas aeruginosa]|nr:hypothetical protein [Pseudomonas aeruginosa]
MADFPLRLLVLKRLTEHLEGVYGHDENGNPYDLRGRVFRGRTVFGADTPLPALSILEAPRPDTPIYGGEEEAQHERNWALYLQGWVDEDKANPTDPAHWLMAAVDQRLGLIVRETKGGGRPKPVDPVAHHLGGLISGFRYGPGVVRPADNQVSSKAYFYMPVQVGLATYVGEPYRSA